MVKRILPILSVMLVVGLFSSASAQWKFLRYFPDTSTTFSTGMNNTIAVDPMGRVWFAPYFNNTDSIQIADGTYAGTGDLFCYTPDGTLVHKYQYFNYQGSVDTLFAPCTGYGMTNDAEGNIIMLKGSDVLRKINYQTGEQMAKVEDPLPGYASSLTSPVVDAMDEVFITTVVPTSGLGPAALSSDFSSILISVDTSMYGAYSRNMSVSSDGNDVYVHHIGLGTFYYHSDNGTLGPYVFVDTVFKDLVIETSAWRPHTSLLYVGSGNIVSGLPNPPYRGYAWYGFDMTNPAQPVLKDSILWDGDYNTLTTTDPRPRGIAFSPSGDTVYVAAFNTSNNFIQMLVNTATPVAEKPNAVPTTYSLSQNYPNPFNPSTKIDFSLKSTVKVTLKVYDVLGREVRTLINGVQSAGQHSVTFNASNLPSGVYIYSLTTSDGFNMTKKMMLMK